MCLTKGSDSTRSHRVNTQQQRVSVQRKLSVQQSTAVACDIKTSVNLINGHDYVCQVTLKVGSKATMNDYITIDDNDIKKHIINKMF